MEANMMYLGLDGDGIGRVIESMLIRNEVEPLRRFSLSVKEALAELNELIERQGGEVIFWGGDSLLLRGHFEEVLPEEMLMLFYVRTHQTASIGIGQTLIEAYLALKLAKSQGGNRWIRYGE